MTLPRGYGVAKGWPLAGGYLHDGAPSIRILRTGDGSVGQTYFASITHGGALQWMSNGVDIPGATGSAYVAQASDVGKTIGLRETARGIVHQRQAAGPVLHAPLLIEGFNNAADWTASAGAALSADAANKVQGVASLQIAGTGTTSPKATKASIGAWTPSDLGVLAWWFKLETDPNKQSTSSVRCCFIDQAATEHWVSGVSGTPALYQTPAALFVGGYWHAYHISDLPALAGQGAQTLGLAVTAASNAPSNAVVRVDALMARAGGRPTVIIGFDDCYATQFTLGVEILKTRGLKASAHVARNYVGGAGRMTRDQLDTLYRDHGWDLCSNSTDDGPLTGKGSVAAAIADMEADRQFLRDNGWDRAADFGCYPNGAIATNGTRVLVNTVTAAGTGDVVLGAAAATVAVGWEVEGYNVPAGTVVQAIADSTHFTLSNPIPAQAKPMSFTSPAPFGVGKLQAALVAAGFRQMRTTLNRGHVHTRFGWDWHWMLFHGNATSGLTIAAFQALVDKAIQQGGTLELYTHGLVAGGGGGHTDPTFYAQAMDYVAAKRDAGELDVLTKSELWARDGVSTVPV